MGELRIPKLEVVLPNLTAITHEEEDPRVHE